MRDPGKVAVIGGGPAGLMAAEILSAQGARVTVFESMPSAGRKLLMAGRGGLNLTHSETYETFVTRYGDAQSHLRKVLDAFPPSALVAWAEGLGQKTFVGSSGRVFPKAMKASPLLRAWLARLQQQGVSIRTRCEWQGWEGKWLLFRNADGIHERIKADATVLALGGASWPRLGATGAWTDILKQQGVALAPLRPANCGFAVAWSEIFRDRFAGVPLKNVALTFKDQTVRGEAIVTGYGIEGGAIYALSARLRDAIEKERHARLTVDLRPNLSIADLAGKLEKPRGSQSLANYLRKAVHLSPLEVNLLREAHQGRIGSDANVFAYQIKAVPLMLTAPQSLARAISTAGGVAFSALDESLMLKSKPGVFVAGEMLDWEAPTGGYLLQACFATGVAAAKGALRHIDCD